MKNQMKSFLDNITDSEGTDQIEQAIDEMLRTLNEEPNTADFYYNGGEYDKAIEHLKKAASLESSLLVHQHLGRLLTELGRYDEAMVEFEKAIQQVSTILPEDQIRSIKQTEEQQGGSVENSDGRVEPMPLQELISQKLDSNEAVMDQGHKFCPVCGSENKDFLPLPQHFVEEMYRYRYKYLGRGEMTSIDQYACPACGASDRQRLYAAWIAHEALIGRFRSHGNLIHFAPELPLLKKIRSMNIFGYCLTADIGMSGVDSRVDLMSLPFPDESFDMFICSHVLEHVGDDDLAISELHRITKKGGCGILMSPIAIGIRHTIEGTGHETNEERWRLFGQDDHLRLYAHDDFVSKVSHHGFHLLELGIDYFGEKLFKQLGLLETSILYVAEKW